jgi:AAA domain-containing protein
MLKVFDPTQRANKRERIIVYAAPGVGKSRFVLSLTRRFGNILYYAADPNSQFLDSISPFKAQRVVVITQEADDDIANFSEFCVHDWRNEEGTEMEGLPAWCNGKFPRIDTLVVDTYTWVMQQAIMQSANQGLAGTKPHFRVGEVDKGGQAIPTWDDYLGTEGLSRGLIKDMFNIQRDMNIIFVCHEDVKQVEGMPATGGPSHPGRKMLVDMPAAFSTVIRLIKEPTLVPGEDVARNRVIAITDHDGKFIAKRRTGDETGEQTALSRVVLDDDPVNFWNLYDSIYAPVSEEVVNG